MTHYRLTALLPYRLSRSPPRRVSPHVHVHERPVRPVGPVQAEPALERLIPALLGALGRITSTSWRTSSSRGTAGAGSSTVVRPAVRARRSPSATAGTGTSSCARNTLADAMVSLVARMSASVSRRFAPKAVRICFSPDRSTRMRATPVGASWSRRTWPTSTPSALSWRRIVSPRASWPTRAIKPTRHPSRATATAWFAPFPPEAS